MTSLTKSTIFITGATGNAGCAAVKVFTEDSNFSVVAGVRKGSDRTVLLESLHVNEFREYDANIYDNNLYDAMKDVNYLFLVPPSTSTRVTQIKNYIHAAKDNGVDFILLFTMLRPNLPPGYSPKRYHQDYDAMEALVETSGIPYAFIRGSLQHQTLFLFVPDIWRNALPLPWGYGKIACLNMVDVAYAAKTILQNPSQHEKKAFHLTGPEITSAEDIAKIATNALGFDVKHVNTSMEGCKRLLLDSGIEEWLADEFIEIFTEIKDGLFDNVYTANLLQAIIKKEPTSLYTFFKDHELRFKSYNPRMKAPYGPPEGIGEEDYFKKTMGPKGVPVSTITVPESPSVTVPVQYVEQYTGEVYEFVETYPKVEQRAQPQTVQETTTGITLIESPKDIVRKAIDEKESLIQRLADLMRMEETNLDRLKQRLATVDSL